MMRVKDLTDEQKKPLLAQSAGIDSLLPEEFNPKTLFDFLWACTHNLANATKAIFNKALPSDFQDEILADRTMVENAVEERFASLDFHLPTCVMLHDVNLGPDTEQERILAEREL